MSSSATPSQEQFPFLPKLTDVEGMPTPSAPLDVSSSGLDRDTLADLILKAAYVVPQCTTDWVAKRVCLTRPLVEELLQQMSRDRLLGVLGEVGPGCRRYAITERGSERARRLVEICGYVGPAPVSPDTYAAMLEWQLSQIPPPRLDDIQRSFSGLVLPESEVHTIALAVMSQRSLFLSGPSGNGKTSVARALHSAMLGELLIPHCIAVGSDVIRIYDEQIHQLSEFDTPEPWKVDSRWVRIKRPLVIVGGEMTTESLDLAYSSSLRIHEAPAHLKANGGTYVIDDFGRQRVDPKELLNRWIIPMEHGTDHLTLHAGTRITVPFRLMLVVATNLDPDQVLDPAFLRRIGYRVYLGRPTEGQYANIFKGYASRCGVTIPPDLTDQLLQRYRAEERELRGCEPRDLIERCRDVCDLRQQSFHLNEEILNLAWTGYFGAIQKTH